MSMNRGTGGTSFLEPDAGIPELMRVIFADLHHLAEYDEDWPLDIGRVTIETKRMPNGKVCVEVAADLRPEVETAPEPDVGTSKQTTPCLCQGGPHGGYTCPACRGGN